MIITKQAISTITSESGQLMAVLLRDEVSKKNILYRCEEMDIDAITELMNGMENVVGVVKRTKGGVEYQT